MQENFKSDLSEIVSKCMFLNVLATLEEKGHLGMFQIHLWEYGSQHPQKLKGGQKAGPDEALENQFLNSSNLLNSRPFP